MKNVFYILPFMYATSALASADDVAVIDELNRMELNQPHVEAKGSGIYTSVREASATIPEETALEVQQADVIDENLEDKKNEVRERIREIEVEIGADHDPINYPKFLASVFTLNFENNLIPIEKIVDGGVVVDEIPTLVNPLVIPILEAEKYLDFTDDEYMAVVEINGAARAYPLRILNWHQGVNDNVGGQPIFVAYDPLSGSVMAIDRRVAGQKPTTFGVTGQVYKSASLYYDRATKSIWAPFENKAVTGPLSGQKMEHYKSVLTTWKSFKENYPEGQILDIMHTGYDRNYRQNPYGDYAINKQMLFPVAYPQDTFARKEQMVGLRIFKEDKVMSVAVPINKLLNESKKEFSYAFQQINGMDLHSIPVEFKVGKPFGFIEVATSDPDVILEKYTGFWFVWAAYNPKTRTIGSLD